MLRKGFSLVELVIVMAVVTLILTIAIPNFRAMQAEGSLTKAETDLDMLKVAVTAFWRDHKQSFPENIHGALTANTPAVINKTLVDPWVTDTANNTYGYQMGKDAKFGDYFILFTKGPKSDTKPSWDAANQRVIFSGSGRVVSNAPVTKN